MSEFLEREEVPTAKEIDKILPKKAIRSIAPNKPFSQEYFNVASEKLKLDNSQQMWLESTINELANDENGEKSTNHLIKALAYGTRGDISFDKNVLKISKYLVLKALNSAAKTTFMYEHNLLTSQEENDRLHDRLDQMQEQVNQLMRLQTPLREQKVLAGRRRWMNYLRINTSDTSDFDLPPFTPRSNPYPSRSSPLYSSIESLSFSIEFLSFSINSPAPYSFRSYL